MQKLKSMNKDKIVKVFKILRDADPEPVTELTFKSHFQLLIAVILSAQATDKSVNAATSKLFKDAPSPEKIFKLGVRKLKSYIKTIGLYNAKAGNVIATSEIIWKQYKNKIPQTREELMKLPGVGRKTANVVLNNAFGQHTIGVDTHVFRVSNRLGLAPGKTVEIVEKKLIKNIPDEESIENWGQGFDGITYIFETSNTKDYFFKTYWTPTAQDSLKEALVVQKFVDRCLEITASKQIWSDFSSKIPFECYINGGPMVACRALTKKERRKLKKERENYRQHGI